MPVEVFSAHSLLALCSRRFLVRVLPVALVPCPSVALLPWLFPFPPDLAMRNNART